MTQELLEHDKQPAGEGGTPDQMTPAQLEEYLGDLDPTPETTSAPAAETPHPAVDQAPAHHHRTSRHRPKDEITRMAEALRRPGEEPAGEFGHEIVTITHNGKEISLRLNKYTVGPEDGIHTYVIPGYTGMLSEHQKSGAYRLTADALALRSDDKVKYRVETIAYDRSEKIERDIDPVTRQALVAAKKFKADIEGQLERVKRGELQPSQVGIFIQGHSMGASTALKAAKILAEELRAEGHPEYIQHILGIQLDEPLIFNDVTSGWQAIKGIWTGTRRLLSARRGTGQLPLRAFDPESGYDAALDRPWVREKDGVINHPIDQKSGKRAFLTEFRNLVFQQIYMGLMPPKDKAPNGVRKKLATWARRFGENPREISAASKYQQGLDDLKHVVFDLGIPVTVTMVKKDSLLDQRTTRAGIRAMIEVIDELSDDLDRLPTASGRRPSLAYKEIDSQTADHERAFANPGISAMDMDESFRTMAGLAPAEEIPTRRHRIRRSDGSAITHRDLVTSGGAINGFDTLPAYSVRIRSGMTFDAPLGSEQAPPESPIANARPLPTEHDMRLLRRRRWDPRRLRDRSARRINRA